MQRILCFLIITVSLTACNHTYYIVRHAEKAVPSPGVVMSTPDDPGLSDAGLKRATALANEVKNANIMHIFSTNTRRAIATGEPLGKMKGIALQTYGPRADSTFIDQRKKLNANTVIIGHSNTVDEIVNGLTNSNKLNDLADNEYDNLFIVRYRRFLGTRVSYERKKY